MRILVLCLLAASASGQTDSLDETILRQIGKSLQGSVVNRDPCEGYHTYICADLETSEDVVRRDAFSPAEVKALVDDFIMDVDVTTLTELERKGRLFMSSCLEKDDLAKLRSNLESLDLIDFAQWPISSDWDKSKFDWVQMAAHFMSFGKPVAIDVRSETILGRKVIALYPKEIDGFNNFSFYSRLDRFLGNESIKARNASEFIGEGFTYIRDNETSTLNVFSLRELKEAIPEFNWKRYISILLGEKLVQNPKTAFAVYNISELRALTNYIDSREAETISYYFLVELLSDFDLNGAFVQSCYDEFQAHFKDILAYLVLGNFVSKSDAKSHRDLYVFISKEHKRGSKLLKAQRYFSDIAENYDSFVGVLEKFHDRKYAKLRIDPSSYLQNKINLGKFELKSQFNAFPNANLYIDVFQKHFVTFYRLHSKPMPFYFAFLGVDFLEQVLSTGQGRLNISLAMLSECVIARKGLPSQQMTTIEFLNFMAARKALVGLQRWISANSELASWQDFILSDYGYTNYKLFFHVYMQIRCQQFKPNEYTFIGHSQRFSTEYNCVPGQQMSYLRKCVEFGVEN